ncbi:glycoside hydrolase family 99-like domain-containing protein [Stutzerimonas stutzeri]|uniref:glycoside hydrolase family 99-like domain-containing protein n=1 Tax=Stutzerimonas stutzeri TaxID=316 RepID=UPI00142FF7D4|nr:glycoside hydrolase family 99-like domain-containing protein [Stutzerimonas stutzeri]
MRNKKLVVVLGMHRCGTSVITRGLQALGVDLGTSLMPASEGNNAKGFWEDIEFNKINIDLLAALGHSWHSLMPVEREEWEKGALDSFRLPALELLRSRFEHTEYFGVKDPRVVRTLPFWQPIFEHLGLQVSYVIACRNPANVARSLASRDGFELEKGYLLWLEHMLLSMKYSESAPRVLIDYDRVLQSPEYELQRIAKLVGLPFDASSEEFASYRKDFLETALRHHACSLEDLKYDPAAPPEIIEVSQRLFAVAAERSEDDDGLVADVAKWHRGMLAQRYGYRLLRRYDERAHALASDIHDKEQELKRINAGLLTKDEQIEELSAALSGKDKQIEEFNTALSGKDKQIEEFNTALQYQERHASELSAALQERARGLLDAENRLQAQSQQSELLAVGAESLRQELLALRQQYDVTNDRLQSLQALKGSPRLLFKALLVSLAHRARLRGRRDELRLQRCMQESGLFDAAFYSQQNADVTEAGLDPLQHYLGQGWREGRNPSAAFSNQGYLALHHDVRREQLEPLAHYMRHGQREGRVIVTIEGDQWRLPPRQTSFGKARKALVLLRQRPELIQTFWRESRRGGLRRALHLVREKLEPKREAPPRRHAISVQASEQQQMQYDTFRVVPFHLDPYLRELPSLAARRVAVHLHLYYDDMTERCIAYLNNIPVTFDLYVSIPPERDPGVYQQRLSNGIARSGKVVVENAPNRGRDIAPFIVQFGDRLAEYDYVGHFHTKKSPHSDGLEGWFDALMDVLCGSEQTVSQIFRLLDDDGKVVFPAGNQVASWDSTGWSDNKELAQQLLSRHTQMQVDDFPFVEFPQGTMFWGKTSCLVDYIGLPLQYSDFPEEPIEPDATLAHALERLILIFTTGHEGRNYRLESSGLSREPQDYYEEQYDYSGEIVHDSIKVLAYYLPQFHPTPLNDEWHGEGFTEWYKVRAANPLFQGHYQQHVPHRDVGYYHLDSPQQLERQAEQMRKSGVHGLIFYHYWFSGTLILENPAQMLLANRQIDMPYSFCWANENWTRRWDGNEQEILLGQVYSPDDARAFIRYLLPFFKDERYIKVEGRPLLFVYRPSSMEHGEKYLHIWREECESEGVPAPYVVATLTRGATSPHDHGMDAAAERVLHDWTGGEVPDIREQLQEYWPLNGSVLNYSSVADHYIEKAVGNDYPLFRSLVPTWDNTARYGSQAYLLHDFKPEKMQQWMEHLIRYSEVSLPEDRRFVIVNAWNEWAEGAHLEPDTRFGYAYLNSIGRALCGHAFASIDYIRPAQGMRLTLQLGADVGQLLRADVRSRQAFLHCLAQAARFGGYTLVSDDPAVCEALKERGVVCEPSTSERPELILRFEAPVLFPLDALDALVKMAIRHQGFHITANLLNDPSCVHDESLPNAGTGFWQRSGMEVRPERIWRGYKVCAQAPCFLLAAGKGETTPQADLVSTVIRFHGGGSRRLLLNALFSLLAQRDCRVQPWLALQDVSDAQMDVLQADLASLPWHEGCEPVLRRYQSSEAQPDLRSLMLNDTLQAITRGYAAFLDYDDVLFPQAYASLLERLKGSEMNASFGRVYSTTVDAASGLIISRERVYDFGHTHEEFLVRNHAPLHSFMLNLDRIDLKRIQHFDDMKYMEDYYLTLQMFTPDGTDWASLRTDLFIGDYVHRRGDGAHTLAISNPDEKMQLLEDAEYRRCEERIVELRRSLENAR